ncbi:unnamed protein product [Arctogadus glacialis]
MVTETCLALVNYPPPLPACIAGEPSYGHGVTRRAEGISLQIGCEATASRSTVVTPWWLKKDIVTDQLRHHSSTRCSYGLGFAAPAIDTGPVTEAETGCRRQLRGRPSDRITFVSVVDKREFQLRPPAVPELPARGAEASAVPTKEGGWE